LWHDLAVVGEETQQQEPELFPWPVLAICLAAAVIRILAARGELWLDEVWTLRLVRESVHSFRDIVLNLKHDNNHFINSFVAYALGPDRADWMYRAPAVLAGAGAVFLAGWTQRRKDIITMSAAVVLTGFSYLLVQYSSEARGYAYEMFFCVLAFAILSEAETSPGLKWEVLFAATCIAGFFTHPTFLIVFLAAQAWTWIPFRRPEMDTFIPRLVFRTLLPGLVFSWLYFAVLRHVNSGGGDPQPYFSVIVQTLALVSGGPFAGAGAYVAAAVTVLLTAAALWMVISKSPTRGSFYAAAIVVLPLMVLPIARREDIYPRYFLVSVVFLLLLWSDFIGELASRFVSSKKWIALALAVFAIANGWHIWQLLHLERGHYQDAIEAMERQTTNPQMLVVVDHPFRQTLMLDYYAHRLNLIRHIEVSAPSSDTIHAAEWLLVHDLNVNFDPPPLIESAGVRFELIQHYPFPGLSGWHLCIYHRIQVAP
jgi:energy-converting hydrogenase Eha subunit A